MVVCVLASLLWVSEGFHHGTRTATRVGALRALNMAAKEKTIFEEDWAIKAMGAMQKSEHIWGQKSRRAEMRAMYEAEVQRGDNYFEGTLGNTRRARLAAAENNDADSKLAVDDNYFKLMNLGFRRRLATKGSNKIDFVRDSALRTAAAFDVGRSKEQQLQAMKNERNKQRPGLYKYVPERLHKYIDYLSTLQKEPSVRERNRAYFLGAFFSFVVVLNASARSSFMYCVVGNLALMSALLSRGQPSLEQKPGMPRRQPASWSGPSFRSALAIQLLYSLPVSLATMLLTAIFPIPLNIRGKLAMSLGLLSGAYNSARYEVFETKAKAGWRWRKAMDDITALDEQVLADQISQHRKTDLYDFDYDPQVDDYPPQPKFRSELEPTRPGGSGELNEDEQQRQYSAWMEERVNSRRAPVEHVEPDEPWVGSKAGMYIDKVPKWLGEAYEENVLNANQWRGKPTLHPKDYSEFEDVEGPLGFRDKRPDWLDMFGTGVWEEKTQMSRKAARAFGTYRKCMHKIDKEVVLQKCDE